MGKDRGSPKVTPRLRRLLDCAQRDLQARKHPLLSLSWDVGLCSVKLELCLLNFMSLVGLPSSYQLIFGTLLGELNALFSGLWYTRYRKILKFLSIENNSTIYSPTISSSCKTVIKNSVDQTPTLFEIKTDKLLFYLF